MKEIWKDIKGFEGLYQISNLGKVKSLSKYKKHSYNSIAFLKEKILKPLDINGYQRVILRKDNKSFNKFIHQLVAEMFIDNPKNYKEVNHKDENKTNNRVDNLEWCSHKYNINYGTGNQRRSKTEIGTKKGTKKIYQFDLKNNLLKIWDSQLQIKKELGIPQSNISNCCNGKRKSTYGYKWRYENVYQ